MRQRPARVFIDGTEFPDAHHRLEVVPVSRLVLSQLFPASQSLRQFVLPPGEEQRVVTVEVKADDGSVIYRCVGPVSSYQVHFDDSAGVAGDKEFLEIAYTSLEFPTA